MSERRKEIAKSKKRPERKQTIITGVTLRMFEFDCKDRGECESSVIFDIVKDYYRKHPPLGFNQGQKH